MTGKRERFDQLMKDHGGAVFRFCLRRLRDRALAEDVLQRVFTEAYRSLDSFQERSSMRTWVFGIAINRCRDAIKARDRLANRVQIDDEKVERAPDPGADPGARIDRDRLDEMLRECIARLQAESQEAVRERFQLELSYEEMASKHGVKADTLRARVTRALPLLRACLEEKGWSGAWIE